MCLATFLANGNLSGFIGPHIHQNAAGNSNSLKSTILNRMKENISGKSTDLKDTALRDFVNLLKGNCGIQNLSEFIKKDGQFFQNGNRSDEQWTEIKDEIKNGNIKEDCMIDDNDQLNDFLTRNFLKK